MLVRSLPLIVFDCLLFCPKTQGAIIFFSDVGLFNAAGGFDSETNKAFFNSPIISGPSYNEDSIDFTPASGNVSGVTIVGEDTLFVNNVNTALTATFAPSTAVSGFIGLGSSGTLVTGDIGIAAGGSSDTSSYAAGFTFFGILATGTSTINSVVFTPVNTLHAVGLNSYQIGSAGDPPSAVPEPSSLLIFSSATMGLIGFGVRRRRRIQR